MLSAFGRLLSRLTVGKKLLLIYLLDLTAVIFVSCVLINEKFIAIDFARKELAGNDYVAAIHPLMTGMAAGAASFDANAAQAALAQAEARHGAGMRSAELSASLARALSLRGTTPDSHHAAFDRARELVTRIGNQSNLILDPDLDSYYTMSLVLLRYPELLEVVWRIAEHLDRHAVAGLAGNNDARTAYFILEGRLDATAKGIESDYAEAFTAASDDRLRQALEGSRAGLQAAVENFRNAGRHVLDGHDATGLPPLWRSRDALVGALGSAWSQGGRELERLIQVRIDGFFTRMWLHLGTALFLLLLILSAVFHVARQISLPLRRLSDVVDRVKRSGDHSLRAAWHSEDEIGRLVVGFNGMLEQLDRERRVQQELAASARAAEAQRDLLEAIPIPMMVTSVPGHEVLHANEPATQWLGGRRADPWAVGLDAPVRSRFFQSLADRGALDEFEVRWHADGTPASWALLSARRLVYQGRDAVLTTFTPIHHLKSLEQRLELWAKVFEASSEGIMILDAGLRILSVNAAFCRQTEFDAEDVVGQHPRLLLADRDAPGMSDDFWAVVRRRVSWQGEMRVRRRHGSAYPAWVVLSPVRDAQGAVTHLICTSLDISERKASEERIRYLAHHDVLTGLPNRSLCIERLRLAMENARRHGEQVALLFIDLDRFKTINDSLGHHVGDGLLQSVARRLTEAVRAGDTVSRLGGDEFVVVLTGVKDTDEVARMVEQRLIPLIRQPHQVADAELHVSCSVGMAMFPDDSRDIDELMRHADVAMYQAKLLGRDSAKFFTPELNERAHRRLRLESHLRHAIERGELALHYQPRVDAQHGRLVGVEALLRWSSAELGAVAPAEFIAMAEESRLIVPIGAWAIAEACRQHAAWKVEGLGEIPVSVNISAVQLGDAGLAAVLQAELARHGVRPAAVELELTESSLMKDVNAALVHLRSLKGLGVKLAVDDFGTGYSSLNYLNRFPIDRLKIDRSFVRDLLQDPTAAAITRAIIGLGHTLGLRVVAEGVETAEAAAALRKAACDELQGYWFARPMAADALGAWMRRRREDRAEAASAA